MPHQPRKSSLRWVVCALLFLVTTVNYMDRSALGLVEPILKHLLGGDVDVALYNRHYSNIVTCFIVAYGLGSLIAGRVIDRVGTKMGLALSITFWAAASIGHAFARTVMGFGIARFALGLGEAGNFPAALKATADWFPPEERALATGIFNSGTSFASLLGPLLIPFVALRFGWQAAFFTTGGFSLLWLTCWLLFPYNRLQLKYGQSSVTSTQLQQAPAMATFGSLLKARGTWSFALSKAATDPVWWFYLYWLPKFFHERFQINMSQIGLPIIIVYVGATVGSIGGGWLAEVAMRRGQSLATAAHQGFSSNLLSTPSDNFPSGSVATVAGIGAAVSSIASGLAITLVGVLWTHYSLLIFFIAGFAYLFTMVAFQRKVSGSAADGTAGEQSV